MSQGLFQLRTEAKGYNTPHMELPQVLSVQAILDISVMIFCSCPIHSSKGAYFFVYAHRRADYENFTAMHVLASFCVTQCLYT